TLGQGDARPGRRSRRDDATLGQDRGHAWSGAAMPASARTVARTQAPDHASPRVPASASPPPDGAPPARRASRRRSARASRQTHALYATTRQATVSATSRIAGPGARSGGPATFRSTVLTGNWNG